MTTISLLKRTQGLAFATAFVMSVAIAPVALAASDQGIANAKNTKAVATGLEKKQENDVVTMPVVTTVEQPTDNTVNNQEQANENKPVNDNKPAETANNNTTNPTGNNGTLKVHEKGTESGFINNDPKVCSFNFEGFGFDVGQSGYIKIEGQGQSDGTYGPFTFGPTVANDEHRSFAETQYFNVEGGVTIPDGHYKATLYGKDTGQNIDLKDVKAKSKVFKVNCESDPSNPVDPQEPTDPTDPTDPSNPVDPQEPTDPDNGGKGAGEPAPETLPNTGNAMAAFMAVSAAIASFVGFASYISRIAYLRMF